MEAGIDWRHFTFRSGSTQPSTSSPKAAAAAVPESASASPVRLFRPRCNASTRPAASSIASPPLASATSVRPPSRAQANATSGASAENPHASAGGNPCPADSHRASAFGPRESGPRESGPSAAGDRLIPAR